MEVIIIGALFLISDFILRLLSVIVAFMYLKLKTRKTPSRIAAAILLVVDAISYLAIHRILLGNFNFISTVKKILFGDYTYHSMMYVPRSVTLSTVIMLAVAYVCSFVSIKKKTFVKTDAGQKTGAKVFNEGTGKRLFFALGSLLAILLLAAYYVSYIGNRQLVITEVQPNSEIIYNHEVFGNYIELHNTGAFDIQLNGLYLSDDISFPKKLAVDSTKLLAGRYMVIGVDNDVFSLKKSGGQSFYLSDETGTVISSVTTEKVADKKSYSLMADGSWKVISPTPRAESETAKEDTIEYTDKVKVPQLSREAGFYDESFVLEIKADAGCTIYYTTDGSLPTFDSEKYKDGIKVYDKSSEDNVFLAEKREVLDYDDESDQIERRDKAFILRAIAVDEKGRASKPVTATYFIDKDNYRNYAVISIVADNEMLYGEDGIFVTGTAYDEWYLNGQEGEAPIPNFLGRGKGYEIPASFEYWEGDSSFAQEIGLRVAGGGTRYGRLRKLNLYARREYSGSNVFDIQLFPGVDNHKLAIGSNFINPLVMQLAKNRDVATCGTIRCNVFFNGEFYMQTSLIEKYDEKFFAEHYGVDEKEVLVVSGKDLEDGSGAVDEWKKIYDFLEENDLSDDKAYKAFGEMIDIQSYIDYMCIRTYIDDTDFDEKKNFYAWRTINKGDGYADGRWRWALFDLDFMESNDYERYGLESEAQKNTFEIVGDFIGEQNPYEETLFTSLYRNADFRKRFRDSFIEIAETTFDYDKVVDCIEDLGSEISDYTDTPLDYYLDFFRDRAGYIVQYMEEKFED